jgi:hypothetical protein
VTDLRSRPRPDPVGRMDTGAADSSRTARVDLGIVARPRPRPHFLLVAVLMRRVRYAINASRSHSIAAFSANSSRTSLPCTSATVCVAPLAGNRGPVHPTIYVVGCMSLDVVVGQEKQPPISARHRSRNDAHCGMFLSWQNIGNHRRSTFAWWPTFRDPGGLSCYDLCWHQGLPCACAALAVPTDDLPLASSHHGVGAGS